MLKKSEYLPLHLRSERLHKIHRERRPKTRAKLAEELEG